tara:strand:+ start:41 stop:799 length:759 start_codon:yes stop_codon:yes gene_type:complete
MASDILKPAVETYLNNYGILPKGDIKNIKENEVPFHDILCAGFPCQPFSQCGHQKGFSDIRGTMFHEIMRIINHKNPRIVILENVPALVKHDDGNTFRTIKRNLECSGYTFLYNIVKCSDYGIPQMRKRLFIVCFKNIIVNDIEQFFDWSDFVETKTLSEFLGRNFEKNSAYTLRCGGRKSSINDRHNWDGYIVDGNEYRLSISDGLKLQGFENFELFGSETQKWNLLGNTIPTIFTDILARKIKLHCQFDN